MSVQSPSRVHGQSVDGQIPGQQILGRGLPLQRPEFQTARHPHVHAAPHLARVRQGLYKGIHAARKSKVHVVRRAPQKKVTHHPQHTIPS